MKKFLLLILICFLCFGFGSSYVYAATSKISRSKLVLDTSDSYTLKITGATSKVAWSSKNKSIATVSTKGKVTAIKEGKTIIVAKVKTSTYICKVEVRPNVQTMLPEICNFATVDIWNYGFCNIEWYEGNGTDSWGQELDIDKTLNDLDKSIVQMVIYNSYIESLQGEEYADLKLAWDNLYEVCNSLYGIIALSKPTPYHIDDAFNTDNFITFLDEFVEECSYFQ